MSKDFHINTLEEFCVYIDEDTIGSKAFCKEADPK